MTDPTELPPTKYASYPSLVDRTVLVTGGADGIGAALVEQFVLQGSKVAFVDINATRGAETVERCRQSGPRHTPRFYEVDLVDIEALRAAIAQAQVDLGGITVLVNNAASDDRHDWRDMTVEYWNDRLNTNLRHYFFAIQAVAPGMIAAQNGSIINIGSSSYMMQEDFFPGYAIAKSGVEGITRTMARTFGPDNVRVNTVHARMGGHRTPTHQVVVTRRRGGHAARPGTQAPHHSRRVRPDGAVPRRRRRRRMHGAAVPRRWWPLLRLAASS